LRTHNGWPIETVSFFTRAKASFLSRIWTTPTSNCGKTRVPPIPPPRRSNYQRQIWKQHEPSAASLAQVSSAEANLENAKLQLSYTILYAPADGRVAKKMLEAGQRVQPSQSVVAIVETYVWVVANFKETQLGRQQVNRAIEAET
jgi:biotin carboxyl carrier protein